MYFEHDEWIATAMEEKFSLASYTWLVDWEYYQTSSSKIFIYSVFLYILCVCSSIVYITLVASWHAM